MADAATVLSHHLPSLSGYESLYKHLHQNPELSTQESETAALIADRLRQLSSDLAITTSVGGHGLFAILKNGSGPTVLLRADFDALPVLEKTGLDYASKKTQVDDRDGRSKPMMHACGHDFHVTCLLAAAETLLAARESWSGTLIFLFQPAEERGLGAQAMVDDGLYKGKGCPIPDVVLGQHVFPLRAGNIGTRKGPLMSAADSFKITIFGRGGHGSMPHVCIDPVVVASHIVVRLQTIVSREVPPSDTAVVTVGSLVAGEAENVIPDEAVIKVDIRTMNERVKKLIVDSIERIVKAECVAGRCPQEPTMERIREFALTDNNAEATEKLSVKMKEHFGDRFDGEMKNVLGSEDFNILGSAIGKPYVFWFWGGYEEKKWDEMAKEGRLNELPVNHSPFFAPILQPTLKTGVETMVVAALTFLDKGKQ